MGAREDILGALRRAAPRGPEHPDLAGVGIRYPDPPGRFAEMVAAVGGKCLRAADASEADRALRAVPEIAHTKRIVSLVAGVCSPTVDAAALTDPHALEGVELAVLPGELAVAENGAVWLEGAKLPHRALVVVPEHLALIVPIGSVVNDMHAAYARLDLAGRPRFGLFMSGPSKTADIEQALVIGAHGARSCTVVLVG